MLKKTITLLSALFCFLTTNAQLDDTIVKMYNEGKLQEIIDTYGPTSNQDDPAILRVLALSYFNLKNDNSYKAIDKAILSAENKIEYYLIKCDFYLYQQKYNQATKLLEGLLQVEENDFVKFKLAQAYELADKYDLAIKSYKELLLKRPKEENIVLAMVNAYYTKGKYNDGIQFLNKYIKANGGSIDTFDRLAILYSGNNDYENSKYYFNKAKDLPANSDVQINSLTLKIAQNDIKFYEFDNANIGFEKLYENGYNENKKVLEGLIKSNYGKGSIQTATKYHSELLKLNQNGKIEDRNRLIAKIPYNSDKGYIEIFESWESDFYYLISFYNTKFSNSKSYSVVTVLDKPIYQRNKGFKLTITNEADSTKKEVSYTGEEIHYLNIIKFIKEQVEIFKKEY